MLCCALTSGPSPISLILIIQHSTAPTSAEEAERELEAKREALEREVKGLHLRRQRKVLREFDRSHGTGWGLVGWAGAWAWSAVVRLGL